MSESNNSPFSNESLKSIFLNHFDLSYKVDFFEKLVNDKEACIRFENVRNELIADSYPLYELEVDLVDSVLMDSASDKEKYYFDLRVAIDSEFKSFVQQRIEFIENLQEHFLRLDISKQISNSKGRVIRFNIMQKAVAASLLLGIGISSVYYLSNGDSDSKLFIKNNIGSENRLSSTPVNIEDSVSLTSSCDTLCSMTLRGLAIALTSECEDGGWGRRADEIWNDLNGNLDSIGVSFSPYLLRYAEKVKSNSFEYDTNFSNLLYQEIDTLISNTQCLSD